MVLFAGEGGGSNSVDEVGGGGAVEGKKEGEVGEAGGRSTAWALGLVEGEGSGVVRGERPHGSSPLSTSLAPSSEAPARAKLARTRPLKSNSGLADVTCDVASQEAKDVPDLVLKVEINKQNT